MPSRFYIILLLLLAPIPALAADEIPASDSVPPAPVATDKTDKAAKPDKTEKTGKKADKKDDKDAITAADVDAPAPEFNTVVLQGLNKVTGHSSKLDGPVGTVMRFGNLEIIAHRCWKSPPEESPGKRCAARNFIAKTRRSAGENFPRLDVFVEPGTLRPGKSGLRHQRAFLRYE